MSVVQTWVGWGVDLGILAINLVGSMRGGNDTVLSSAESEPNDHATLPRSKATLASANASTEGKQDDGVHSITGLFGNLTFGHPKEYEGGARREPVGERLVSLIEPSINKKGRISCENLKVFDRDEEEEELPDRESVPSPLPCHDQGAECVSPTSASDDGDSSPRTKDDFKSSPPEKDQVKVPSTSYQPEGSQSPKDQPTTPKPETNSLKESSDHPTPKGIPSTLPKAEDDEQDDNLDCLVNELGRITLQGTQNPADDTKAKLEQEKPAQPPSLRIGCEGQVKIEEPEDCDVGGSVPSTPCSRGEGDYHHFLALSGWYYFDDYHNVYAQDGTLVHDASFDLDGSDPSFYIHGVPYWLNPNGSLFSDASGTVNCVRTWTNKHYFHTSSGWYFFDDHHNVYMEDGTLVHDGSLNAEMSGLLGPMFYIDGASYWFALDALWCQASTDALYCVHTWKSEPGRSLNNLYGFYASDKFYYLDMRRNLYSKAGTLMYDGSSSVLTDKLQIPNFYINNTPYWLHNDGMLSRSADGTLCRVLAWVQDLYSFHTLNGLCYFDRHRNVYSDQGTYVHNRSHYAELDGVTPLIFHIDGDSYWFNLGVLRCQVSTGARYRVHTWQSELNRHIPSKKYCFFTSGHFYHLDDHRNVYSEDGRLFHNGSSSLLADKLDLHDPNFYIGSTPYWLHTDGLLSRSTDGTMCRVVAWVRDLCSMNDNSEPLQKGLQGGMLAYSPESSSSKSPNIIEFTADGCQMPDTSLFVESDPDYIQGTSTSSQHKTAKKTTKNAQPVRKRGDKSHLRCPHCGKENRRPVALKEHILTHTKEKPNVCPFEDCSSGFATRSNMKRHFDTHRAGCTLEEYERNESQSTRTAYNPYQPAMPHHSNKH